MQIDLANTLVHKVYSIHNDIIHHCLQAWLPPPSEGVGGRFSGVGFPVSIYISEASFTHNSAAASLGIRQSPRGLRLMLPTFGPSGRQLRLNC